MEPITIGLISVAVFGTVMVVSAFIRQLLLSRDKRLNDEALRRALAQEVSQLEKIRTEMQSEKRFQVHYQMLGENKNAIQYLDNQIDNIFHKKAKVVARYVQLVLKESSNIIANRAISPERKAICDKLRKEIDETISSYDSEIVMLQQRRLKLWDSHIDFQMSLLQQEQIRNANLDNIRKQHSALLEKLYLRHLDNAETVAVKMIDAGTISFKDMLMAPIQFLMQFFGSGIVVPNIAVVQARIEQDARQEVEHIERDINDSVVHERFVPYREALAEQSNSEHEIRAIPV